MEFIFSTGIIIFALFSIYFLLYEKKEFNTAFFVSFITLCSYIVMLEGRFITQNTLGLDIYWTRWIAYALSCSLLVYQMTHLLGKKPIQIVNMIFLTVIVMITGALASVSDSWFMILFFLVSTVAYILLLNNLISGNSRKLKYIELYVLIGWTLFPAVFILSSEGVSIINNFWAGILYLILDIFTKIVFYLGLEKAINVKS